MAEQNKSTNPPNNSPAKTEDVKVYINLSHQDQVLADNNGKVTVPAGGLIKAGVFEKILKKLPYFTEYKGDLKGKVIYG